MSQRRERAKLVLLLLLVAGITAANYLIRPDQIYYGFFVQALYFIPLVLAAFWFGFRGAVLASAAVTVLYLPFVVHHWTQFNPDQFESLLEILIYNFFAWMLGWLRDRDLARQRRLRDSERLAAMGRAVSSLAHDMKTPLVAIGGFARLVLEQLPEDDPDRERLGIVVSETQRLEHMVRGMLDYSGNLRISQADEDVNQIVRESLAVVREIAAERDIQVQCCIDDNLPLLICDGLRIRQLLINLLTNAIDSSPSGGLVTVQAQSNEAHLILEVVDRGAGIPKEQRPLIFEPFFTTKAHGTGLGLSIVKKIVDAHQGGLEVLDNPDQGLTFRVSLPLVPSSGN